MPAPSSCPPVRDRRPLAQDDRRLAHWVRARWRGRFTVGGFSYIGAQTDHPQVRGWHVQPQPRFWWQWHAPVRRLWWHPHRLSPPPCAAARGSGTIARPTVPRMSVMKANRIRGLMGPFRRPLAGFAAALRSRRLRRNPRGSRRAHLGANEVARIAMKPFAPDTMTPPWFSVAASMSYVKVSRPYSYARRRSQPSG